MSSDDTTGPASLSLAARIEAILYLNGRPLDLAELARLASLEPDVSLSAELV